MMNSYLNQPREVSLETFAFCNARCTFCPYPSLERKGTKLPFAIIDRLIGEMKDWSLPFFISPFKVNEPLLDDRLQSICEDIVTQIPNATLRIFTNGQPLIAKHMDWLSDLPQGRVAHVWVSLNEINPQRYGETMGLSLSVVLSRLDNLHERVRLNTFHHPVTISRVSDALPPNVYGTVDDVLFMKFVQQRWPLFHAQIIKRDGWLGAVNPSSDVVPKTPCGRWFELSICADGKAALCCMDGTGEFSIGNVYNHTLLDLYNQPHLVQRRLTARNRDGIEPCQRCTY